MYFREDLLDTTIDSNQKLIRRALRRLLKYNTSIYGLRETMRSAWILDGTTLKERHTVIGTDCTTLRPDNTVLFTGQCLVKKEEDLQCPITLEDAIECERLKEVVLKKDLDCFCMLPDMIYASYLNAERITTPAESVQRATQVYAAFRQLMIPGIRVVKLSEMEMDSGVSQRIDSPMIKRELTSKIRRIYGGRVLKPGQQHPLQSLLINYGLVTLEIPRHFAAGDKDIAIFAEPDEICSLRAAEAIVSELGRPNKLGLVGSLALPSLSYFEKETGTEVGDIRMYSTPRSERIHLNEDNDLIKAKLEKHPLFTLTALILSPLTSAEELKTVEKQTSYKLAVEILMEQTIKYKKLVREAL